MKGNIVYAFQDKLYVNLTNRCTNRCLFCDKDELQRYVHSNLLLHSEPGPEEILEEIKNAGTYPEIVFCGVGEPLLRLPVVLEVLRRSKDSPAVFRMNTNGHAYIVHPGREVAKELAEAGLDKVNISVNAVNPIDYERICRPNAAGAFENVAKFMEDCRKNGIDTTASFVDGYVDREAASKFAAALGVKARVREKI